MLEVKLGARAPQSGRGTADTAVMEAKVRHKERRSMCIQNMEPTGFPDRGNMGSEELSGTIPRCH